MSKVRWQRRRRRRIGAATRRHQRGKGGVKVTTAHTHRFSVDNELLRRVVDLRVSAAYRAQRSLCAERFDVGAAVTNAPRRLWKKEGKCVCAYVGE
jgi:hypothetical protein